MKKKPSFFETAPDIVPIYLSRDMSITELVNAMGQTCFEARNVHKGATLLKRMINEGDTIWLGIAGAGVAGGMGGMIISLMKAGFVHVICSTGAQIYHDLHFAFALPVKAINPRCDDNMLRRHGDTRIFDIGVREQETLEVQDVIIRNFIKQTYKNLSGRALSSWEFNFWLGDWVNKNAKYPERSFVATAADLGVPVFWDSLSNHSIAMNLALTDLEGYPVIVSAQRDILDSAAIVFSSGSTGFVELGGGGPKNFIQQTSPTISQILGIEFKGANRGLQIGTAVEREGSLSSCTFGESVTWGKYRSNDASNLVQIWGEYSVIFPLLAAYILDRCEPQPHMQIVPQMPARAKKLADAR